MTKREMPARSLQEWMERHETNGKQLCQIVRRETGRAISETALSFILRGSRRCSVLNADALSRVTGVPFGSLREWPRRAKADKLSAARPKASATKSRNLDNVA